MNRILEIPEQNINIFGIELEGLVDGLVAAAPEVAALLSHPTCLTYNNSNNMLIRMLLLTTPVYSNDICVYIYMHYVHNSLCLKRPKPVVSE